MGGKLAARRDLRLDSGMPKKTTEVKPEAKPSKAEVEPRIDYEALYNEATAALANAEAVIEKVKAMAAHRGHTDYLAICS